MSHKTNDIYLETMREKFEEILAEGAWENIDEFYKELEADGMEQYTNQFSQMMSDEDVVLYKKWDKEVNGDTNAKMDDDNNY